MKAKLRRWLICEVCGVSIATRYNQAEMFSCAGALLYNVHVFASFLSSGG